MEYHFMRITRKRRKIGGKGYDIHGVGIAISLLILIL